MDQWINMEFAAPVPPLQPLSSIDLKDRPLPDFLKQARADQHAVRGMFAFKVNHDAYMNIMEAGSKTTTVQFKSVSPDAFKYYASQFPLLSKAVNTTILALEVSHAIVLNTWVESEYIFPAAYNWITAVDRIMPGLALLLQLMPESRTAGERSLTQNDVDKFFVFARKLNEATLVYALCLRLIGAKMARKTPSGMWSGAEIDLEASTDPFLIRLQTDATMFKPTMFQAFCESAGFGAESTRALMSSCVAFASPLVKCLGLAALNNMVDNTVMDVMSWFKVDATGSKMKGSKYTKLKHAHKNRLKHKHSHRRTKHHRDTNTDYDNDAQPALTASVRPKPDIKPEKRQTAAHRVLDEFTGPRAKQWLAERWAQQADDAAAVSPDPASAAMVNQVKQMQVTKANQSVERYRDVGTTVLDIGTTAFDTLEKSKQPKKEAASALGYAVLAGNLCQVGTALTKFWMAPTPASKLYAVMTGLSASQHSILSGIALLAKPLAPATGGGSVAVATAATALAATGSLMVHALTAQEHLMSNKGVMYALSTILFNRFHDFTKVIGNFPLIGFVTCLDPANSLDKEHEQIKMRDENALHVSGYEKGFFERLFDWIFSTGHKAADYVETTAKDAGHVLLGEDTEATRAAKRNANPSMLIVSPAGCRMFRDYMQYLYNKGPTVISEFSFGIKTWILDYCVAGFGYIKSALRFFADYLPENVRNWLSDNYPHRFANAVVGIIEGWVGYTVMSSGWVLFFQVLVVVGLFFFFLYFFVPRLINVLSKISTSVTQFAMDFFNIGDPWKRPKYKAAFQKHLREYTRAPLEAMKRLVAKTTPIELLDLQLMHRALQHALETNPDNPVELDALRRKIEIQMRAQNTSVFRPMAATGDLSDALAKSSQQRIVGSSTYLQE
jgi:hypothetical protein